MADNTEENTETLEMGEGNNTLGDAVSTAVDQSTAVF